MKQEKQKRNLIKIIIIAIFFLLYLLTMEKDVQAISILEQNNLQRAINTRSNYENLIVNDEFVTGGVIINNIMVGAGANPTVRSDKDVIINGETVVFTISALYYDIRIENKEDVVVTGATNNYEIDIESEAWFLNNYVKTWTVTIKNINVLETEEKEVYITFNYKWRQTALGKVYTESAYEYIIVDNISPKISINPNEQTNYTNGTEVIIHATDLGGLKENQEIQYAWSKDNINAPTTYTKILGTNVSGAQSSTWIIPKSSTEELTGEYYLWIKEGTITDIKEHKNDKVMSQKFLFDGTVPTVDVSYNPIAVTNGNVIATITANENIQVIDRLDPI